MHDTTYYLQVVESGKSPSWPENEEELVVGSQDIGGGWTQYWAYHNFPNLDAKQLPEAERLAVQNSTDLPAILVHQREDLLILVLVNNGHALSYTTSSIDNLEDNITILTSTAKDKFNLKVENFMTTTDVTGEVEQKLDDLDDSSDKDIRPIGSNSFLSNEAVSSEKKGSATTRWVVIILILLSFGVGGYILKDKVIDRFSDGFGPSPSPTIEPYQRPTPTPSPTPAPQVDRTKYKLRVLNGTDRAGAAKNLADKLQGLGWQILSIGNATPSAVARTQVRAKSGQDDLLATAVADLGSEINASTSADLNLADKADGEIVIGKE